MNPKINPRLEYGLYLENRKLWSVLKVLQYGGDRLKSLVWSDLDENEKARLNRLREDTAVQPGIGQGR